MSEQSKLLNNEDIKKIGEFITNNYPPREENRAEDELMQKIEELEETGLSFSVGNNLGTMSVMTSLPATERVFVTINEMAKILGIGHNSIRQHVRENPTAEYIFTQGNRVYLKRELFINTLLEQSTL